MKIFGKILLTLKKEDGVKNLILLPVLLVFFALCKTAMAIPYVWEESKFYHEYMAKGDNFVIEHGLNGFVSKQDLVTRYQWDIVLVDDQRCDPLEIGWFNQPGWIGDGFALIGSNSYRVSAAGLLDLNHWGGISGTLSVLKGDFILSSSTLTAQGRKNSPAPVPEPTTIMLLAVGLIGTAVFVRKKT